MKVCIPSWTLCLSFHRDRLLFLRVIGWKQGQDSLVQHFWAVSQPPIAITGYSSREDCWKLRGRRVCYFLMAGQLVLGCFLDCFPCVWAGNKAKKQGKLLFGIIT